MGFIKNLFFSFVASGLALWGTDYFMDVITIEHTDLESYIKTLSIAIVVLGLINIFIKPILQIFSFPFLIITLGLFSIVIHAIVFYILTIVVPEIVVHEFWGYLVIPVILGILNWVTHLFVPSKTKK